MIASMFGYSIAIALLGGLAAASAEILLAELRRPRRFAWLGAFAAALVFPPLAWMLASSAPSAPTVAFGGPPQQLLAPYAAIDWNTTLVALWIAATTTLLMLYAAAWLRLSLLAKRWPQEASDATPVVVADDVGPAVLGVLRPRILLPRWLMHAPAAVRTTVVAHELEHIAARDQACIVAAQLVTVLLPWNLPLWWSVRRLRAAIELDCDARVLSRGVSATHYADVLLTVAQRGTKPSLMGAALIEPVSQLERRIRAMLTTRRHVSFSRTAAATAASIALAACATQLTPPAMVTSSAPLSSADKYASWIEVISNVRGVKLTQGTQGDVTLDAPELVIRVSDSVQGQGVTQRRLKPGESAWLAGGVRMDFEEVLSISASRAQVTGDSDGTQVWTLSDAKVVRAATATE